MSSDCDVASNRCVLPRFGAHSLPSAPILGPIRSEVQLGRRHPMRAQNSAQNADCDAERSKLAPISAQNAAKCADLRSQQCVDLGRLGSAPFFAEDVLVTADAAFLRRTAASAVRRTRPEGRGARGSHTCERSELGGAASRRRQFFDAERSKLAPNRCRTQHNDPQIMQNAAKRRQINAESSKTPPN